MAYTLELLPTGRRTFRCGMIRCGRFSAPEPEGKVGVSSLTVSGIGGGAGNCCLLLPSSFVGPGLVAFGVSGERFLLSWCFEGLGWTVFTGSEGFPLPASFEGTGLGASGTAGGTPSLTGRLGPETETDFSVPVPVDALTQARVSMPDPQVD